MEEEGREPATMAKAAWLGGQENHKKAVCGGATEAGCLDGEFGRKRKKERPSPLPLCFHLAE